MPADEGTVEHWKVGGKDRLLNIADEADVMLNHLTLGDAADRLKDGLQNLQQLAVEIEKPKPPAALDADAPPRWFLQLDHEEPDDESIRTRFADTLDQPQKINDMVFVAAAKPLSQLLKPLELDAITTVDDDDYWPRLKRQRNLPQSVKDGIFAH